MPRRRCSTRRCSTKGRNVALPLSLGIVVGFAALAVIFTLFYRFGVRIPLRPFFAVTSVLLYYMAFVFMGKGMRELQEGNALPITAIPGFPHVGGARALSRAGRACWRSWRCCCCSRSRC